MDAKKVRLDDQGWARLAVGSWLHNRQYVASSHYSQPSLSDTSSIQDRTSFSWGSFATSRL
ncbi:hypothetical protein [Desulfonatronospira thiodismutans]|uniref:hypothetical protein n=1 Tax=Desulfonatronospira thiodismutans TaxID=488939 RepID=UPI001FCA0DB3|nr:hypothetical protein [Desulfonatronospira thiodismutans]